MKNDKVSLARDESVQLAKLLQVTAELCQRCGDEVTRGRALLAINLLTERLDGSEPADRNNTKNEALSARRGLTNRAGEPIQDEHFVPASGSGLRDPGNSKDPTEEPK